MPDVAKCSGTTATICKTCWRKLAPVDQYRVLMAQAGEIAELRQLVRNVAHSYRAWADADEYDNPEFDVMLDALASCEREDGK